MVTRPPQRSAVESARFCHLRRNPDADRLRPQRYRGPGPTVRLILRAPAAVDDPTLDAVKRERCPRTLILALHFWARPRLERPAVMEVFRAVAYNFPSWRITVAMSK